MSKDSENTTSHETNSTSRKQTLRLTRRRIMQGGAGLVGLATAASAGRVLANTQQAIAPEQGIANPNGKFASIVVLITGATSGIGEATARAFAKQGAIVHFCGSREALGAQVAQNINAAGGRATYQRADVRVEKDVKAFIRTNTIGEFLSLKYEIPHMRRQGGGVIVNMASIAGHSGFKTTAHYCASKHGIIGLTRQLRVS